MSNWPDFLGMNHAQSVGLGTTSQGTMTDRHSALAAVARSDALNQQLALLQQQYSESMYKQREKEHRYMAYYGGRVPTTQSTSSPSSPSIQSQSQQPSSEDSSTTPDEINSSSPSMTKKTTSPVYKQGTLIQSVPLKASTMDVEALPKSSKSTKARKSPAVIMYETLVSSDPWASWQAVGPQDWPTPSA
jgi:hypothetical protein